MKGTSKPRGKCLELEKKTESEVVIKNDEDCAAFCAKKHFGCLDYRKGANQMLSCAQACHMWVALDQSKDQCMSRCDRHGNSGCTLTVNGEELSMCSRCDKHVFKKSNDAMCKFGVCSVDACKTGCSVTSAKEIGNCDDDNKKADAVCKGSCKELARSCGNQLGCGSWTGDVATFCPRTCGKCSRDKPSAGPCLMLNCSPEYELVETDD